MMKTASGTKMKRIKLYWQIRTMLLLWLTYATFYIGRVNMSVALPAIQEGQGWGSHRVGLIGAVFFWVYAVGQLINGQLGDRFSSRIFVFCGLLGTALMNGLFAKASSLLLLVIIWGINGYFQSTGWGPIVKTASKWVDREHYNIASVILGTSFVIGSTFSWYISGQLLEKYNQWELLFRIPSLALLVMAIIWVVFLRNTPSEVGLAKSSEEEVNVEAVTSHPGGKLKYPILRRAFVFLQEPFLRLIALITVIAGMFKEGLTLWAPTLISQSQGLTPSEAVKYSLAVPLMGLVGVFIGGWLHHILEDEAKTLIVLFGAGVLASIGVLLTMDMGKPILLGLSLGSCAMVSHGINVIIVSLIPMHYTDRASSLAGFLDFCSYIGAGIMSVVTGITLQLWSWTGVLVMWVVLNTMGVTLMSRGRLKLRSRG